MTADDRQSTGSKPLALLSAPGSRGDVNPMVAIGRELTRRGFDVAISLAEPYVEVAENAGLQAHSSIDRTTFDTMLGDKRVWNFVFGMRRVLSAVAAEYAAPHVEWIRSLYRPGRTVLVSHPLDFGSRVFRDLEPNCPLVGIHLAPVMLRTKEDPPHLTPWGFGPGRTRATFDLSYWIADRLVLDRILGKPINRLRRRLGLPSVRRLMHEWWLSPDAVLAMYPDWFAPATKGFLPQLHHAGFPLEDVSDVEFDAPSNRPVVFTGGTANRHSRAFFERAQNVCVKLNVPGILLASHEDCFPSKLADCMRTMRYAPLGKLLPHCRAIVHHGGIGTTSQALACGVPQSVRPMAFDQFDNAAKVIALDAGKRLRRDEDLKSDLGALLKDKTIEASLTELSQRSSLGAGAINAADRIERVLNAANGKF
ncbi:MAG: nucleotide disphospho-sugar-binding domain-containing protein [Planctomycetota bacterium]